MPHEYQRQLPTDNQYEMVVAGGGPAGCAAAISAARLGARVLLIEATGCLGGMGTAGLVSNWFSICDGTTMLPQGLFAEILDTMYERGELPPHVNPDYWRAHFIGGTGFNAEGLKLLLDELCEEAGVTVRFGSRVVDAEANDGAVHGVVVHDVQGLRFVKAKAFVDATGDAYLAHACGIACFEAGRDTKHIMPPTLCGLVANVDWSKANHKVFQEKLFEAIHDGILSQPDRHVPGIFRYGASSGTLNAGHIFGMDALDAKSLSEGYRRGRQLSREYANFARRFVPGCENLEHLATASLMGVRESRRIIGEYTLNYQDFCARRHHPDQIAVYNKAVDIHVYDCSDAEWERFKSEFMENDCMKPGESYGIPYGVLVPRGSKNLWVAGRCNSSDVKVSGAIRDQPACFAMGQAAGTAAVQSLRTGQSADTLDTALLVTTLREAGAYLPQPELTSQMTRSQTAPPPMTRTG